MSKSIILDTPARIHLGFLDLNHLAERNFGSIGLTISKFKNIFEIKEHDKFEIESKDKTIKKKIEKIFKKFSKIKKLKNCKIIVSQNIPQHVGLGSGTQISLSVGYLISEFNNLNFSINEISQISERGLRSGIGIQSFKTGGFIVDSGKAKGSNSLPLTIFNKKWPKQWKIILVFDQKISGIFGKNEVQEFNKMKKEVLNIGNINCKTVLMKILPSIIEKDFANFSSGIQIIQDNMSKIFYRNKKNKFASKEIELIFNFLKKKKIFGFGQTSWGPTGFIFCENINEQNRLEKKIKNFLKQKKISNISLTKIDGRNKGSIKINR